MVPWTFYPLQPGVFHFVKATVWLSFVRRFFSTRVRVPRRRNDASMIVAALNEATQYLNRGHPLGHHHHHRRSSIAGQIYLGSTFAIPNTATLRLTVFAGGEQRKGLEGVKKRARRPR